MFDDSFGIELGGRRGPRSRHRLSVVKRERGLVNHIIQEPGHPFLRTAGFAINRFKGLQAGRCAVLINRVMMEQKSFIPRLRRAGRTAVTMSRFPGSGAVRSSSGVAAPMQ